MNFVKATSGFGLTVEGCPPKHIDRLFILCQNFAIIRGICKVLHKYYDYMFRSLTTFWNDEACEAGRGESTKETWAKAEAVTDNASVGVGCTCRLPLHSRHKTVSVGRRGKQLWNLCSILSHDAYQSSNLRYCSSTSCGICWYSQHWIVVCMAILSIQFNSILVSMVCFSFFVSIYFALNQW